MGEVLLQGLSISLIGLLLTFAALALLILVIILLNRLLPGRAPQAARPAPEAVPAGPEATPAGDPPEEVAAAIAVALEHWRQADRSRAGLGQALAAGPGRWWQPALVERPRW